MARYADVSYDNAASGRFSLQESGIFGKNAVSPNTWTHVSTRVTDHRMVAEEINQVGPVSWNKDGRTECKD
jgi:hypothetical protein